MNLNKNRIFSAMIIIAFGGLIYAVATHVTWVFQTIGFFMNLLAPFVVGGVLAFLLNILLEFVEEKIFGRIKNKKFQKIRRPLSLTLTLVFLFGVIIILLVLIIPELGETIRVLAEQVPSALREIQKDFEQLFQKYPDILEMLQKLNIDWNSIWNSCIDFITKGAGGVVESTMGMATGLFSGVVTLCVGFIFALYILLQKERLGRQMRKIFDAFLTKRQCQRLESFLTVVNDTFAKFMAGRLLDSCLLAIVFYVLMSICQLPYALLTATVVGVTALIPILGSWMGGILGCLFMVTEGWQPMVVYLVIHCIVRPIDENVVYPKIVQKSVNLPAIWVLVAVTIGGSLCGIIGMLIFIPIASILYEYFRKVVNRRITEKERAIANGENPDERSFWQRLRSR